MATVNPQSYVFHEPPRRTESKAWIWILVGTGLFMAFLLWECGSGLYQGHKLADSSVQRFHQELNDEQYDRICDEAESSFRASKSRDQLVKFFTAIHSKLGNEISDSMTGIRVNATTTCTYVVTSYTTKYGNGSAEETFTWIKSGGKLKLVGYNVQSDALVVN
jgi:hypothetical protein